VIPERHVRSEYRRSAHSAQSSNTSSDSIVVTHPFHPLTKRRLRILFERRRGGERFYICECAEGTVTLAEDWTDRGEVPAARPLTYERLADLHKALIAIKGS
jgi:uncharacterized protein DUF5372